MRWIFVQLMTVLLTFAAAQTRAETLVIVGATLVDTAEFGRSQDDVPDAVVIIENGRIVAIGPRGATAIPPDATVVEAAGNYLIPGLIDGFSAQNDQGYANAHLAMGVTTIVVGGIRDVRRGMYVEGSPQPNARFFGMLTGYDESVLDGESPPPGVGWPSFVRQHGRRLTDEELRVSIDAGHWAGLHGMLLYYTLDDDQVRVAAAHATRLGMFTIGELGHASYVAAASAGVRSFVHSTRYEAELAPPDLRSAIADDPFNPASQPLGRRYSVFLTTLDSASAEFIAYARALASQPVGLMPTLMLGAGWLPEIDNPWVSPVGPMIDPIHVEHLPYDRVTGRPSVPPNAREGYVEELRRRALRTQDSINAFHDEDVRFLVGSGADAFGVLPGWGVHREIRLLVAAGLTPREALAAATENFAALYEWRDVGRIAPGYRGDLVLLEADPAADATNLERIAAVYLAGRRLDRDALLAWRPSSR